MADSEHIIAAVKQWVENIVIGLNLCPFAKRELQKNRLHFAVSDATTEEQLLIDLQNELRVINNNPAIETTLLIHPYVLQDFYHYNQFLDYADALLVEMNLEGVYQIASFHPNYQFADTEPNDPRNYSNKSPYPMLHLISEEGLEKAIAAYPDSDKIPQRNQELLLSLGQDKILALQTGAKNEKN